MIDQKTTSWREKQRCALNRQSIFWCVGKLHHPAATGSSFIHHFRHNRIDTRHHSVFTPLCVRISIWSLLKHIYITSIAIIYYLHLISCWILLMILSFVHYAILISDQSKAVKIQYADAHPKIPHLIEKPFKIPPSIDIKFQIKVKFNEPTDPTRNGKHISASLYMASKNAVCIHASI